jgi:hypothetical protein
MGTQLRSVTVAFALGLALLVVWLPAPNLPRGAATVAIGLVAGLMGRFGPLALATVVAAGISAALWFIVNDMPAVAIAASLSRLMVLAVAAAGLGRLPFVVARRRAAF